MSSRKPLRLPSYVEIDASKVISGVFADARIPDLDAAKIISGVFAAARVAPDKLTTQGDILIRNAAGYARLGYGTSGQFLKTQGADANPAWADAAMDDASLLTKGILHVDRLQIFASNTLRHSNDTLKGVKTTTYVKKKEMKLNCDLNQFRTYFEIQGSVAADTTWARIYRNGVAVGTERSVTGTGYTGFYEDFNNWVKDDLFQIYIKGDNDTNLRYIRNQRILYDLQITKTAPTNQDP